MSRIGRPLALALTALSFAAPLAAQERGRPRPSFQDRPERARDDGFRRDRERIGFVLVATAADADFDLEVTPAEWSAFLAGLGDEGAATLADFRGLVVAAHLDHDGDGVLEPVDLASALKSLDANDDDALQAEEMALPGRSGRPGRPGRPERPERDGGFGRGEPGAPGDGDRRAGLDRERGSGLGPGGIVARLVARAADADRSSDVTAAEWSAYLAAQTPDEDGALSATALADALLADRERGGEAARGDRPRPGPLAGLEAALDPDGDGRVDAAALEELFARHDEDGDGTLGRRELMPTRGSWGGERPGRGRPEGARPPADRPDTDD
jgi:hypothetical protein